MSNIASLGVSRVQPYASLLQQRHNFLAEPLHFLQHRMELQKKSRYANVEKLVETVGNLLRSPNEARVRPTIRANCAGTISMGANHNDLTVHPRNRLLGAQGVQPCMLRQRLFFRLATDDKRADAKLQLTFIRRSIRAHVVEEFFRFLNWPTIDEILIREPRRQ